ncbi:MAG: hypothetical protein CMH50_09120 [Myxococcales bacterium]|nr:hypothetical protein [Myxococcales bacterium]
MNCTDREVGVFLPVRHSVQVLIKAKVRAGFQQALRAGTLRRLALTRILVGGCLMLGLTLEDLQILTEFTAEVRRPSGLMKAFALTPLHGFLLSHPSALLFAQVTCFFCLLAVTLGLKTRIAIGLSLLLQTLIGGLLREHSIFYHSEQLLILLLAILLFTPCAAVWSFDARLQSRQPSEALKDQASLAVFLIWASLATAYWSGGISKIIGAGWNWFDADGLRVRLLACGLDPIEYGFGGAIQLAAQPDWVFVVLATIVLGMEMVAPLLLFSRRARLLLPLGYISFHIAVFVLQNILFLELILLQVIFMACPGLPERKTMPGAVSPWHLPMTFIALGIVLGTLALTAVQRDFYPLSAYKMYAKPANFPLRHSQIIDSDGEVVQRIGRLRGRKQLGLYIARAGKECVALQRPGPCTVMRHVIKKQLEKSGLSEGGYRLRVLSRRKDGSDDLLGEVPL